MGAHDGHRKRLMERLDSGKVLTHEELEMLLFYALPRKNTNGLAHKLIAEFGSVRAVFGASVQSLSKVEGVGLHVAAFLSLIGKLLENVYILPYSDYEGYYETSRFIPYIKNKMAIEKKEVLEVYSLNNDGEVVRCRRIEGENVMQVSALPREISHAFYDTRVKGILLVHNHPYGSGFPSDEDDFATSKCQILCSSNNIILCDHLVVGSDGVYSYYMSGKLGEYSHAFSPKNIVERWRREHQKHE